MRTWYIRLGKKNQELPEAYQKKVAAIGFGITTKEELHRLTSFNDVKEAKKWLEDEKNLSEREASQVARFVLVVEKNDYLISGPSFLDDEAELKHYIIGKVKSDPFILETPIGGYLYLARKVDWKLVPKNNVPSLSPGLQTLSSLERQLPVQEAELLAKGLQLERVKKVTQFLNQVIEGLKSIFLAMSPEEFEEYIADLLEANGWGIIEVTRYHKDEGIDILADVPILQGSFKQAIVQVKRRNRLTAQDIEEIIQSHETHVENEGNDLFYLICAGKLTRNARKKLLELPSIILIDGDELARAALSVNLIPGETWPFKITYQQEK